MIKGQLLVHLKTRDPAAVSAYLTLTRRLGFGNRIRGLERATYYELEIPGHEAKVRRAVSRLLEESTLLANPNKERTTTEFDAGGLELPGVSVLVWDHDGSGGAAVEDRIAREFPRLGRVRARRGVLWTATFSGSSSDHRTLTERMTRADSRMSGLLANPHAEDFEIVEGRIPQGFLFKRTRRAKTP